MSETTPRRIAIAGAGVAGLTAALAFASYEFDVAVFERALRLEEAGAGLQLSPNASRLLGRLGVLDLLRPSAVQPDSIILRDGGTLRQLARLPLGEVAEKRWGAPYLVAHRADLQRTLLARAAEEPRIRLILDAPIQGAVREDGIFRVLVENEPAESISCRLLVGADGVHSTIRGLVPSSSGSSFGAEVAWRTTIQTDSAAGGALMETVSPRAVTAFLRPNFHLIAYPVRAGREINLVAFTRSGPFPLAGGRIVLKSMLDRELSHCASPLRRLPELVADWTDWPLHTVELGQRWIDPRGIALIGDAAHAMTPYAAQGAAMAIEDAVTLADAVAPQSGDLGAMLSRWESERRPRIAKVARRAVFNRFAWHAAGPIALARNLVLAARGGESLAADMDWLYGWDDAPAR